MASRRVALYSIRLRTQFWPKSKHHSRSLMIWNKTTQWPKTLLPTFWLQSPQLWETTPSEKSGMSIIVARKHQITASREQMKQYSPGFNQTDPSYWKERNNISSTRGSNSTSRAEGSAITSTRKKTEQGCIQKVQKESGSEDPKWDLILETKCKENKEKRSASE